jgi:predicted signal transduction protein with EAL and GGDEF domain
VVFRASDAPCHSVTGKESALPWGAPERLLGAHWADSHFDHIAPGMARLPLRQDTGWRKSGRIRDMLGRNYRIRNKPRTYPGRLQSRGTAMKNIALYELMSRRTRLPYRGKIMLMAFVGTHVPLIALIAYVAMQTAQGWSSFLTILGVALLATLLGTFATILVLDHLLRPVINTAQALRDYRARRALPDLPVAHTDDAGRLMADAQHMITSLDESLLRLETIDEATGLLNRDGLQRALAADTGTGFAIMSLRLLDASRIGGSYNQDVMHGVMSVLADRLGLVAPNPALLARVADDRFALAVAMDVTGADAWEGATDQAMRIVADIASDILQGDLAVQPTLVAGVALIEATGDVGAGLDDAIAASGEASAADRIVQHSEQARAKAQKRFALEQELRGAIAKDEFVLHFQPVMDTQLGRVSGAEALIRWNHPDRGMIPPGLFIPMAEEAGVIDQIGLWVMRDACRQAAAWEGDIRVAINLSARQFLDKDLDAHVAAALSESGLSPDRLELELTETVAMVDHDHSRSTLTKLRDQGLKLAIDDFGTGYASMSSLRKLPFNKLKIDREFVSDVDRLPQSQAICSAMIALGRGLGMEVLAEGTETSAEVDFLRAGGCSLFQGFHFARPVASADLATTIAALDQRNPDYRMAG